MKRQDLMAVLPLVWVMMGGVPLSAQFPNLADLTGINVDVPNQKVTIGAPNPGGFVQQTIQAIGNLPGAPLAAAIRAAQSSVGTRYQVPPDVYPRLLSVGISEHTLRRASWSPNWSAVSGVTNLVARDVVAVTLDDVVVFRDANGVQDAVLWAHELRHVDQYERMGVDGFAAQYAVNAWVLENEAKDQESRVRQALFPGQQLQSQAPQQFAYFVVTGQYLYADASGLLYPANPNSGAVLGPANGRVYLVNGAYWASDSFGRQYPAVRVR